MRATDADATRVLPFTDIAHAAAPLQLLTPKPPRPDRPLFVFLPGMDGTGQLLRTQLSGLSQAFDIRCLALSAQNDWHWPELIHQTLGMICKAAGGSDSKRAIYLCGESFGGCLALQLAAHAPWLFRYLIVINPASSFRRLPWLRWGEVFSHRLPTPLYRLGMVGLVPFLIRAERVAAADREALWQAMASVPAVTASWRLSLLGDLQIDRLPLERLQIPTLLIAGESDALLPSVAEVNRLHRRLPDSRVITLPHSGHACLLERDVDLYTLLARASFIEQSLYS